MKILFVFLVILGSPKASELDADTILSKVDANMISSSRIFQSKMIIHGRRGSRTVVSKSWVEGDDQSFTEYLAPAREKGVKMLKLEDQLWTYSPSTDRIIRISGHMLRQSVMGSDLSYEDFMEDTALQDLYDATVAGEDSYEQRKCWVLELVAKKETAYPKRKIWVDQERFVPLKEERYAKSGKLLKVTEIKAVKQMDGRWVASHILFKDNLKKGSGTEFIMDDVEFDATIPRHIFSKAGLRK